MLALTSRPPASTLALPPVATAAHRLWVVRQLPTTVAIHSGLFQSWLRHVRVPLWSCDPPSSPHQHCSHSEWSLRMKLLQLRGSHPARMRMCVCVCVHACVQACVCACGRVCACTRECACVCAFVRACIRACVRVRAPVCGFCISAHARPTMPQVYHLYQHKKGPEKNRRRGGRGSWAYCRAIRNYWELFVGSLKIIFMWLRSRSSFRCHSFTLADQPLHLHEWLLSVWIILVLIYAYVDRGEYTQVVAAGAVIRSTIHEIVSGFRHHTTTTWPAYIWYC